MSAPVPAGGPNAGYAYVSSIDLSNITFGYVISPALQNTGSAFYQCQTGIPPIISGSDLAHGMRRHEAGTINSHYAPWAAAWSDPDTNYGQVAEALIAGPTETTQFNDAVVTPRLTAVTAALIAAIAAAGEPCAANYNDSCTQPLGLVNYCIQ